MFRVNRLIAQWHIGTLAKHIRRMAAVEINELRQLGPPLSFMVLEKGC